MGVDPPVLAPQPSLGSFISERFFVMYVKSKSGPVHKAPPDLRRALGLKATTQAAWKDLTPLARNEWICWIISAKQSGTRSRRIDRAVEDLRAGKRRPCCWPGCPHRRSSARKWFERQQIYGMRPR